MLDFFFTILYLMLCYVMMGWEIRNFGHNFLNKFFNCWLLCLQVISISVYPLHQCIFLKCSFYKSLQDFKSRASDTSAEHAFFYSILQIVLNSRATDNHHFSNSKCRFNESEIQLPIRGAEKHWRKCQSHNVFMNFCHKFLVLCYSHKYVVLLCSQQYIVPLFIFLCAIHWKKCCNMCGMLES